MDAMAEYRRERDEEHERLLDALYHEHAGRRCECGAPLVLNATVHGVELVCDGWPQCGYHMEVA